MIIQRSFFFISQCEYCVVTPTLEQSPRDNSNDEYICFMGSMENYP